MSDIPYYILAIALALLFAEFVFIAWMAHRRMKAVRNFEVRRAHRCAQFQQESRHAA
jgi:hypothetical protein